MAIREPNRPTTGAEDTRESVISAIYETVIRPELYSAFMEAWESHIVTALGLQPARREGDEMPTGGMPVDPQLRAHFERAYQILEQLGRTSPPSTVAERIAGAEGFSLLVTPGGEVASASAAAWQFALARQGQGEPDLMGALGAVMTAGSSELLGQLLRAAQAGEATASPVVLATEGAPRHLLARITPTPAEQGSGTRLLVVIEALEYRWSRTAAEMLVTSFGLSRAEVQIVRNLLAGSSLREIALASNRSEHTVRNQAKSVLAKTGAPGQVDLIRLVVFLINQQVPRPERPSVTPQLTEQELRMSDGRAVQVFGCGPPSGRAVIYLHGMADGMSPLLYNRERLAARGLRVIAPVRPGFGRSEPIERVDRSLDVVTAHLAELIERMALERPLLLGHAGGALYAQVAATRLGDRVAGAVCVSGGPPFTRLGQFTRMAPRQRVVAYTARFAPALLPTVLRAGIAQIDGKEVEAFMTSLFRDGTHDRAVIDRLGIAGLIQDGYRFTVEQGYLGFLMDSHFMVRDWRPELGAARARVIRINGARDPILPPDTVTSGFAGMANCEVRILEDCGQLLFYERPAAVLDAVAELLCGADPVSA